jgi:hypothetical protein
MKPLSIESTEFTPNVTFNPDKCYFEIAGVSRPENVMGFYDPLIKWLRDYEKKVGSYIESAGEVKLVIKLDYFNSSTSKYLLQVLEVFKAYVDAGHKVVVEWYYDEWDDQMLEDGEDLAEAVSLDFEFIPKEGEIDDE